MGEKLLLITKNPRFLLACKSAVFGVLLWLFWSSPGLFWGFVYGAGAGFLYFRPLFNSSASFFLLVAEIALSIALQPSSFMARVMYTLGFSCIFFIILGIKNLVLTNRERWMQGICYILLYISVLDFFLHYFSRPFWFAWVFAILMLLCILLSFIADRRLIGPVLVLLGELLWVVSWLPIGFLASANIVFLVMVYIGNALREKRLTAKNSALFIVLIAVVLGTSYWKLQ